MQPLAWCQLIFCFCSQLGLDSILNLPKNSQISFCKKLKSRQVKPVKYLSFEYQGSKLVVAVVQNMTDLRLFAPKILDLGATLLLKLWKLILAWQSKSLISFLAVNLRLKGFSLEA